MTKILNNKYLLLGIICVLAVSIVCAFIAGFRETAHADYTEDILNNPEAIVNFNQLVANNLVNGYTFPAEYNIICQYNFVTNHKIYINFNVVNNNNVLYEMRFHNSDGTIRQNVFNGFISSGVETIITLNNNYVDLRIYAASNGLSTNNIKVIDLTQMFGAGNEPNLQQCKDLFVSDYYAYNIGTPVSFNSINAYVDGVNSVLSGQSIHYSREYVAQNMQAIRFNDITGDYSLDINSSYPTQPRYLYTINDHVQITFASIITAGQNFKFKFWLCRAEYNDITPLEIGYFIQSNFYPLITINATAQFDNLQYYELDLIAPVDMNAIVLNIPHNYALTDPDYQWYSVYMADIELTYILQDATALLRNAQDYGYNQAKQQYETILNTYSGSNGSGNSGYMSIYYEGYQAGQNASVSAARKKTYTFTAFLGALFDVPVSTIKSLLDFNFLGFNLKNFVFSLLTLSIVFALIKFILVKSAGGGDK